MNEERVDISPDDELFQSLSLLLAVCEQTTQELDQAEIVVHGLREDLEALSSRLYEVLGAPPWGSST